MRQTVATGVPFTRFIGRRQRCSTPTLVEATISIDYCAYYRVELIVENTDGFRQPGMTTYVRIEFGRQMEGRILMFKIKQALRPELWIL